MQPCGGALTGLSFSAGRSVAGNVIDRDGETFECRKKHPDRRLALAWDVCSPSRQCRGLSSNHLEFGLDDASTPGS
jgi:hypothetical protein